MALDDDLVVAQLGVDPREVLDRLDRGAHDERQERGLDAVGLREILVDRRAHGPAAGHVDLEERGDVHRVVDRLAQVARDHLADRRHVLRDLVARDGRGRAARRRAGRRLHGCCRGGCRGGGRRRSGGRSGRGRSASPPARCCSTSLLVTRPPRPVPGICAMSSPCSATMRATTGDMNERRSRLSPFASASEAAADDDAGAPTTGIAWKCGASAEAGGATSGASAAGACSAAGGGCLGSGGGSFGGRRRSLGRRGGRRRGGGRATLAAAGVDHGDLGAHVDGLALGHEDLAHRAGGRRGHLGVDLVGRDLDDGLVRLDRLTDLLAPGDDRALGHADSHLRHDDIDERSGTHGFLPAISRRRACGWRPGRRRPAE